MHFFAIFGIGDRKRDRFRNRRMRKQYGIEVPEAEYIKLATLDSCAEYLTPKFDAIAAKKAS